MAANNEGLEIFKGALLVLGLHSLAGLLIFGLGFAVNAVFSGYAILLVWVVGAGGFLFWQLLYVLPLTRWLQRRGKHGMVKGAISVAVLTALVNGTCFLAMR
jgi:hypothetical protein